jgi:membrane protein implicated in regulation of membrane protease activity
VTGAVLEALGAWSWLVIGLVLIGLEILAPGAFLLWLGLAALLTGLIDGALGLSWQAALIVYCILAVVCVLVARRVARERNEPDTAEGMLNRRAQSLVGRSFVLDEAVEGGHGRLRLDDTSWRVTGPDLPRGSRIRVVAVEGTTLVIEPA